MAKRHSGGGTVQRQPAAAEVEAELKQVLASRCFEQAGRAKEFLRFVVEETLAGRGDRLKGYAIGIAVFSRPADFDAQADPLVRVEARRLRSRLLEYYLDEGKQDPVRIELRRGGYAAQFAYTAAAGAAAAPARSAEATEAAPLAAPQAPRIRPRQYRVAAVVSLLAAAAVTLLWFLPRDSPDAAAVGAADGIDAAAAANAPRGPRLLVPAFANLSGSSEFDYFAYGMTEEIALRLSSFDVIVVAAEAGVESAQDFGTLSAARGAEYLLTGTVRRTPDRIRVSARLVAVATGAQLWGESFEEPAEIEPLLSIQERIAERVAATVGDPFGPLFRQEAARASRRPAETLDTYDCVLQFRYYRRMFDERSHGQAVDCFRRAVQREPGIADAWAGLALMYLDEYFYSYNVQAGEPDALTRGLEAARTALDIDGDNALANLALARLRFAAGDFEGFDRATERLFEVSPNNPDDLFTLGALRGIAGDWERGLPLLQRASALAGGTEAGVFSAAYALYEIEAGRYDDALAHALRIDAPQWYMGKVILIASAGLAGRLDIAERAAAQLLEQRPGFGSGARAEFAKWHGNETLVARLVEGLNAAGVDVR